VSQTYQVRTGSVRNPNTASETEMTRRAWWLVVLNVLIPGSAQAVAGSRRLGKFGLAMTLIGWVLSVVAILLWVFAKTYFEYSILTNPVALGFIEVVLVAYAIVWVILTLDTLRLTRLIKAGPTARGFVAGFAIVALVATAGTSAYAAYITGITHSTISAIVKSNGPSVAPINGRYNIMLLGGDAGPDRVGLRPDSISVISLDANSGAMTMIGVPRDMQKVPFVKDSPMYGPYPHGYNCGVNCLVSFLYTYGQAHPSLYPNAVKDDSSPGIEATKDAVEGILGITIQYYVLVDMAGFKDLVNALGGVTVDVTEKLPINGGQAPDGQPIDVSGWIYPGVQKLDGYKALWYARSRHSTNDYDRMARQRQLETAVLKQFTPQTVLGNFQSIATAGKEIVTTDIPSSMLPTFLSLADKARTQKVTTLELVPPAVFEPNPNFAQILTMVSTALTIKKSTPKP
jgi:LCP family protein required for cell wall assembly